ncbi:hypothetical protein Dsin_012507 [Dipteronia sinensis]|uniref:Reverse transcriptase domain-containing protein n=1 Tax=Dipteronia sinensis TaxID=43782 RepID=A0AAE0AI65_9ROSI|nr:hypothetical protein Dsin_012507 [Dipteronia sinensis]
MSNLGFSEELFLAESRVHHELDVLLRRQECFYRDLSRVKWLQDGDLNSSFFQASVRRRQYKNALSSLSINGVLTDDRLIIRDHIIEFYSNLFSSDSYWVKIEFSVVEDVIPSLVIDVENAFLIKIPSTNDIHDAVLLWIQPLPLGRMVFLEGSINSAGRWWVMTWFLQFWTFFLLTSVHVMHKKCYIGNLAMKIDIRKAFDTLDWSFLRKVLQAFGFSPVFMDWIDSILGSSRLSVLNNGSPEVYFHCSRGVRQGDPLSPLLFVITEDFLSRLQSMMVDFSQLLPISSPRGFFAPTHLLYADDVLIFCRGTVQNLKNIMSAFEVYGNISGQLVNWDKSSINFGSSVSPSWICRLQSLVDKILSKFAKWKRKALSLAGRATQIKSIITGSFVHSFMIYKWPSSLLRLDLGLLNGSLLKKFTWKFMTSESFAFSFLRERYLTQLRKSYGEYFTSLIWPSFHSQYSDLLKDGIWIIVCKTAIHDMVWSVWLALNKWIFESKAMEFISILSLVWRAVSNTDRLEIGCMRNCVDDLLILHQFDLGGRLARALVFRSVIWSPPAPGWIKVNTDGATLSSPGVGGCRGVFRNCRALVKGCFTVPLG